MCDTKKCTKCGKELPLNQFYKQSLSSGSTGYQPYCKNCLKIKSAKWWRDHPEKNRAKSTAWRIKNKSCRIIDKEKQAYNDLCFKIKRNIRSAIWRAFNDNVKTDHTEKLLGCSIEFLRQYLENQFTEGMTWNNYGVHGWHIDHIIPLSYFDFTDPEQQKRAWHYTNLRPLWAIENIRKSNKIKELQLILL
jgi:hypothetical protein